MVVRGERWPPVYDLDDLVGEIKRLTASESLEQSFFEWRLDRSTVQPTDVCQGDVVLLHSDLPVILQDGQPAIVDHPEAYWLVLGNTCDFERRVDDVRWTQLVPITSAGPLAELNANQVNAARRYTQTRRFYVPPWSQGTESELHVADLLMPVAVDKRAFTEPERPATVQARLSRAAWILLNACLVRFLARDDGRYD